MAFTHTASKVKVYASKDYKLFRSVEGNRSLNKKKIERIIKDIESGNDILDEVPILVKQSNGHLDVLDGQHRLAVAERLKRPVHYILRKEEMSLLNVAKVNSNTEKWTPLDFINAYKKAGNSNYEKLDKFHKEYGIAVGSCLKLLTHGDLTRESFTAQAKLTEAFQSGTFEVKKYKEAVQVAEICKSFNASPVWNTRPFIVAMSKILKAQQCDMDVLLKKFNRDPKRLLTHSTWKAYLTNLEEIYNIDNSKRRVIY